MHLSWSNVQCVLHTDKIRVKHFICDKFFSCSSALPHFLLHFLSSNWVFTQLSEPICGKNSVGHKNVDTKTSLESTSQICTFPVPHEYH